jgi:predicted ATPase
VEDVKVTRKTWQAFADVPFLEIREKGGRRWIPENRISSGMFRTLMHLSSVMLWPDGTVILIDEFENSLGVNCLDEVTKDLLTQSRRLQFILTSHHPYIINNIDSKHWKIVTRKGPIVTTHDAKELGIGRSRHEAFLQLLNADAYREGIAAG